jgi:hypothetical protein
MLLYARFQGHARYRAQGIIGVPRLCPDPYPRASIKPEAGVAHRATRRYPAVIPGTQAGRLCYFTLGFRVTHVIGVPACVPILNKGVDKA